jgi:hypothetical protein
MFIWKLKYFDPLINIIIEMISRQYDLGRVDNLIILGEARNKHI